MFAEVRQDRPGSRDGASRGGEGGELFHRFRRSCGGRSSCYVLNRLRRGHVDQACPHHRRSRPLRRQRPDRGPGLPRRANDARDRARQRLRLDPPRRRRSPPPLRTVRGEGGEDCGAAAGLRDDCYNATSVDAMPQSHESMAHSYAFLKKVYNERLFFNLFAVANA